MQLLPQTWLPACLADHAIVHGFQRASVQHRAGSQRRNIIAQEQLPATIPTDSAGWTILASAIVSASGISLEDTLERQINTVARRQPSLFRVSSSHFFSSPILPARTCHHFTPPRCSLWTLLPCWPIVQVLAALAVLDPLRPLALQLLADLWERHPRVLPAAAYAHRCHCAARNLVDGSGEQRPRARLCAPPHPAAASRTCMSSLTMWPCAALSLRSQR